MYTNTVQNLKNIDIKLFELQMRNGCTYGRTEKAIPRPASTFGDAGKNSQKTNYLYKYI
jgi:hypothetical protein